MSLHEILVFSPYCIALYTLYVYLCFLCNRCKMFFISQEPIFPPLGALLPLLKMHGWNWQKGFLVSLDLHPLIAKIKNSIQFSKHFLCSRHRSRPKDAKMKEAWMLFWKRWLLCVPHRALPGCNICAVIARSMMDIGSFLGWWLYTSFFFSVFKIFILKIKFEGLFSIEKTSQNVRAGRTLEIIPPKLPRSSSTYGGVVELGCNYSFGAMGSVPTL